MSILTNCSPGFITQNGGKIIKNNDGTVSVFVNNGLNNQLIPSVITTETCCKALDPNYTFNIEKRKCYWDVNAIQSCQTTDVFKLVLNPNGNDGAIFTDPVDEICTLDVSFDYLFKFNCEDLSTLLTGTNTKCPDIISLFENIGATMIIEANDLNNSNSQIVYSENVFNKIGANRLYRYLSGKSGNTGFYVCGLSNNPLDTKCYDFNLYDLTTNNLVTSCGKIQDQLLSKLATQANIPGGNINRTFRTNIDATAFASNWLNYTTQITDVNIINQISNKKIKLSIELSGTCIDTCVLLDNIKLDKNCTRITRRDIFSTKVLGFELDRVRDNKKSWVSTTERTRRVFSIGNFDNNQPIRYTDYYVNDERLVINTKEIDLDINLASAIETDIWYYISDNPCLLTGGTIGTTFCIKNVGYYSSNTNTTIANCTPKIYCCSEYCGGDVCDIQKLFTESLTDIVTVEDFKDYVTSLLIDAKNRKTINTYPTLRMLYERYMNSLAFCGTKSSKFDYKTMDEFANLIGNYWVDLIEQVVPATTIWGSTRIYSNTVFDAQKFPYKAYTLFFGNNDKRNEKVLSPVTGDSCSASATTSFIKGSSSATTTFFTAGNKAEFNNVYPIQMNSSSEFISFVTIVGSNTSCAKSQKITNCTLQAGIVDKVSIDGTLMADAAGATSPVTYLWTPTSATTMSIGNLTAGTTYKVNIKDECCESEITYTPICQLMVMINRVNPTFGNSNGSVTANVIGGQGNLTYQWINNQTSLVIGTTQTIGGLSGGSFTLNVFDSALIGCSGTASTTLVQTYGYGSYGGFGIGGGNLGP